MADMIKILAQSNPAAANLVNLFVVPVDKSAVISSVVICNLSDSITSWRLAIAEAGASDSPEQYLYYDLSHPGKDTFIATIGITLDAGDVIRVYSADGNLSFNLFGVLTGVSV